GPRRRGRSTSSRRREWLRGSSRTAGGRSGEGWPSPSPLETHPGAAQGSPSRSHSLGTKDMSGTALSGDSPRTSRFEAMARSNESHPRMGGGHARGLSPDMARGDVGLAAEPLEQAKNLARLRDV